MPYPRLFKLIVGLLVALEGHLGVVIRVIYGSTKLFSK